MTKMPLELYFDHITRTSAPSVIMLFFMVSSGREFLKPEAPALELPDTDKKDHPVKKKKRLGMKKDRRDDDL